MRLPLLLGLCAVTLPRACLLGLLPSCSAMSSSRAPKVPQDSIIAFFHGGKDPLNRTHDEMLAYSLDRMEECHDCASRAARTLH